MKKYIYILITILSFLFAWEILYHVVNLPKLIPSTYDLVLEVFRLFISSNFYISVEFTILRGILGLAISLIAAVLFSFLFVKHNVINEICSPLISLMRTVPVISFILLALIFFHTESIPLIIAFLTMFPLLTENISKGLKSCNKEMTILSSQFSLTSYNKLTQIIYPQVKPYLFSGLASAMGFGWRAIIMGEVLAQCAYGIGGEMKKAQIYIEIPTLLAWTIIAVIVSILFDKAIRFIEKRSFPIIYSKKNKSLVWDKCISILLKDVCYSTDDKMIIKDFNYCFKANLIYGLSAPSGVGKTTLLNLVGGIIKPSSGKIEKSPGVRISMVFHSSNLINQLTIKENISLALSYFYTKENADNLSDKWLNIVDLAEHRDKYPDQLSYGQQQRSSLARALAFPGQVFLLDEPFRGLNRELSLNIIKQIKNWFYQGDKILIFSTHDAVELEEFADEVLKL